jgi:hypothetical protein
MGKKIECYLDCGSSPSLINLHGASSMLTIQIVSPYSFYAFTYLQQNADALASLGVEIEYEALHSGLSRK